MQKTMRAKSLKPLAISFATGGVWDAIAGFLYIFAIGNGRIIDNPPMHPFYSIFLGSFFLCFAYLQILSSLNIQRYSFIVGCLILGRIFYVVTLFAFMAFSEDFPATFWFTGIIDGSLAILYITFAHTGGLKPGELFFPKLITKKQTQ